MTTPYSPYPSSRKPAYSRNVADVAPDTGATETIVIEDYDAYDDEHDLDSYDDYDDYDDYTEIDRRWIWVGGVAAAILLVAIICTVVILGGGDSGSVSATVSPPAVTTTQAPSASARPPAPPAPPAPLPSPGPLAPETVSTVAPTPTAIETPTVAAPAPRTITYQVTGSRQLLDLVTVIYTDQQGALQTDVNVALPWNKTVVLDPGVDLTSVTATSLMGKLNCSITDGSGALINAQTTNSMIATCTK